MQPEMSFIVATVAATAAVLMLGFTLGKGRSRDLVDLVREDRDRLHRQLEDSRKEIEELRREMTHATPAPSAATAVQPVSADGNLWEVKVAVGETQAVGSGRLFVTLVDTPFTSDGYKATFTFGAPKLENERKELLEPGARVLYADYEIRVVSVRFGNAVLRVERTIATASAAV